MGNTSCVNAALPNGKFERLIGNTSERQLSLLEATDKYLDQALNIHPH